jgi:glutamine amidotransferase
VTLHIDNLRGENAHHQAETVFKAFARALRAALELDVVFPGVGAIRDCMAEIRRLGFDSLVREVSQDRPFLGICVGMQALLERSEENDGVDCIGLFPGEVKFFGKDLHEDGEHLKVPHMGWNEVRRTVDHPLWHEIPDMARFYFVHSYYIAAGNPRQVVGGGHYGVDFAAALAEGSRFAVQFHPEKSHTHGLQLLQNFAAWDGVACIWWT